MRSGRRLILATGKASVAMAAAAAEAGLSGDIIVLAPVGVERRGLPDEALLLRGGHPLPSPEGIDSSRKILERVRTLGARDRLLYLISGGSSALFEVPAAGISTGDLIETYRLLLGCGAPIADMNCVRRRLSALKGGRLAAAAKPAETRTLALSDVAGDDPAAIGSGPTVEHRDPAGAALGVVERYGLREALPTPVLALLCSQPDDGFAEPPPEPMGLHSAG